VGRAHGGRPPPGTIDLSAPQNPLGPPHWALAAAERGARAAVRYPDYEYRDYRRAVHTLTGASPESIVPLNGSAEAVPLLLAALRPRRLVALEPTFGDHALQARALGVEYVPVVWRPGTPPPVDEYCRAASAPGTLGLASNPDNPHGGMLSPETVREMASCTSGVLHVDEAFIRLSDRPGWSLQRDPPPGVVVSGSLTKDLALPGARIGYLIVGDPGLARLLDDARQPWNVNTMAVEVAVEAAGDPGRFHRFLEEARSHARTLRERLLGVLRRAGLEAYESHAPYVLARGPGGLHRCLAEAGFYTRDASTFTGLGEGWVRFSLPPPRLAVELERVLGECVGV